MASNYHWLNQPKRWAKCMGYGEDYISVKEYASKYHYSTFQVRNGIRRKRFNGQYNYSKGKFWVKDTYVDLC